MITKRERLEAAITGDMADRPPVALWRHFPVDDQDPSTLAEASAEFQNLYDFDFIKVTPASSFCLRDWGVEDDWRGNPEGTRDYTRRVIHDSDDWPQLNVLDPQSESLAGQLRCLELIREQVGQDVPKSKRYSVRWLRLRISLVRIRCLTISTEIQKRSKLVWKLLLKAVSLSWRLPGLAVSMGFSMLSNTRVSTYLIAKDMQNMARSTTRES